MDHTAAQGPHETTGAGQCEICRGFGRPAICAECRGQFAASGPRCPRCALRLPQPAAACGHCLRQPPTWQHAVSAVDYGFPWDGLIAAFKFQRRVELAGPLARELAAAVAPGLAHAPVDLVTAVPLAPARLAERGYNQAWELARRVARTLHLPASATLLQRPLDGAHQAALPRAERARNLRGAFVVPPDQWGALRGRRIAVVDDVLTTGATAQAAAEALLHGGAAEVQVWTLARTP